MKEKTIKATLFDPKKFHPYSVKTTGRHPIHMIEGGDYITEDKTVFDECSDMGWFHINQKEYDLFKSMLKDVTIKY
jgi:hypothetical protein